MIFSVTELLGLALIAVLVIAIGWAVTRLDNRVGTPADPELELDDESEAMKLTKPMRRRR